jgi:uncharacterized protein YecT (DUF1311 family)
MKIEWNKVTWYSKTFAVVLFVGIFCLGIKLGEQRSKVESYNDADWQMVLDSCKGFKKYDPKEGECIYNQAQKLDTEVEKIFQKVLAETSPALKNNLLLSQDGWLAFRNSSCPRKADRNLEAGDYENAYWNCISYLTILRIDQLAK